MAAALNPDSLISSSDMQVVERVLGMSGGYVLDFSNRTFDDFLAYEMGVDATAPRYSEDGFSKARRLRRILTSLTAGNQAKLLRAFLVYRDDSTRAQSVGLLDEDLRKCYEKIISALEQKVENADQTYAASSWTGRRTIREQVAIVRGFAPLALREIDELAAVVETRRFNDPLTAEAVQCLRELHQQLGDLTAAVDHGSMTRQAIEAIERNRERLTHLPQGRR